MSRDENKNKIIIVSILAVAASGYPFTNAQAMSLKCEDHNNGMYTCASMETSTATISGKDGTADKQPTKHAVKIHSKTDNGNNPWLLPEPGTIALMGLGLGVLGIAIRRRRTD